MRRLTDPMPNELDVRRSAFRVAADSEVVRLLAAMGLVGAGVLCLRIPPLDLVSVLGVLLIVAAGMVGSRS